jgi:uncharacterized protein (TIGR03435 family)
LFHPSENGRLRHRLPAEAKEDERRIQTQALFQQLLADRFPLTVHWEMKGRPIYALRKAGKNDAKLQPTMDPNGAPQYICARLAFGNAIGSEGCHLDRIGETLTRLLSREVGRDILDQTGIEGKYDLRLSWTSEAGSASIPGLADGEASTDPGPLILPQFASSPV